MLIDAEGLVVGRLAADRRPAPARQAPADLHARMSIDGDNVIVINADKVVLTGRKREDKTLLLAHRPYRRHQGAHRAPDPRGPFPERVLEKAVERMMPRGPLGRRS